MNGNRANSASTNSMSNANNMQGGFLHQPKVLNRQNLDFLSSFNNNANGHNFKRETPKNTISGSKLMQDFQSLFFNSPTNTQRSNNHILSNTFGAGNESSKHQPQPQMQSPSNPQNILKATNQKLLFPGATAQTASKMSRAKFNNFLNEETNNNDSNLNKDAEQQMNGNMRGSTPKGAQVQYSNGQQTMQTLNSFMSSLKKLNKEENVSTSPTINTKENTNSYVYHHQQQLQMQSTKSTQQQQAQFYRPPSSDRNWRNSTLKAMSTTQLNNQFLKKEPQDNLRNSFDPVTKTSRSNTNSPQNTNFSYNQPAPTPTINNERVLQKPNLTTYITNLNRGDDLISNALQNASASSTQRNSKAKIETADQTPNSNNVLRKDNKPQNIQPNNNSLRNSQVVSSSQYFQNQQQQQLQNQRSTSASKESKGMQSQMQQQQSQKQMMSRQMQQANKQVNLALPSANSWISSAIKPSTTKEQARPKNFLFFENSENIATNQVQTTKANGHQYPSTTVSKTSNTYVNKNNVEDQNNNTYNMSNSQIHQKIAQPLPGQNSIVQEYYMAGIEQCYQLPLKQDYFSQIYREHFLQTFQGIQYAQIAKPANPHDLQSKRVFLKAKPQKKKTIIFDLDETLIHCNENTEIPSDVVLTIRFPQGEILEAGINVRPFAVELLKELCNDFEIVVFTASHSSYAKAVLDYLDPHKRYIHHRFFRDQCIITPQGVYIKDLRIFADRNPQEMVLVDNAAYSFAFQIENGIPIIPFYENKKDEELKILLPYLRSLKDVKDVREVNRNAFKFFHYSQCESAQKVYEKIFQTPQMQANNNNKINKQLPVNNFLLSNKNAAKQQANSQKNEI